MSPRFAGAARVGSRFTTWSFGVALVLVSSSGLASEGQWAAGASAGAAFLRQADPNLQLGLRGAYGLSEALQLDAQLLGSRHETSGNGVWVSGANLGAQLRFDVIEWVPYLGLRAGVLEVTGKETGSAGLHFAPAVAYGVEHLYSRQWAVGVEGEHTAVIGSDFTVPYHSARLVILYRWGW